MLKQLSLKNNKSINGFIFVLGLIIFFRLLFMFYLPLTDNTEARYGLIAKNMVNSANWVTPQQELGTPFWAKPPLSTWSSAISMEVFGLNEIAARLPSLVYGLLTIFLLAYLAVKMYGRLSGILLIAVLLSCFGFYLQMGAVMTDPSLVFCLTLILCSYWLAIHEKNTKLWSYLVFIGAGLGMLAKGPLVIVLSGLPILLWSIYCKKLTFLFRTLPWFTGTILFLLIWLPWYVFAEIRTPGFLQYFIIGEHLLRYLDSGWSGDLYGNAHSSWFGKIWFYWLAGCFPWSIILIYYTVKNLLTHKNDSDTQSSSDNLFSSDKEWQAYLWLWFVMPMLFFTFSSNIIWTYILPSIPAFSLLVVHCLGLFNKNTIKFFSSITISFFALFAVVAPVIYLNTDQVINSTHKDIIQDCRSENKDIFYYEKIPFSANFYSDITINQFDPNRLMMDDVNACVVFKKKNLEKIKSYFKDQHVEITVFQHGKKWMYLKTKNNSDI